MALLGLLWSEELSFLTSQQLTWESCSFALNIFQSPVRKKLINLNIYMHFFSFETSVFLHETLFGFVDMIPPVLLFSKLFVAHQFSVYYCKEKFDNI